MIHRSCQVVLLLMVALALLSPVIQRNSPDNFPVAGDDIELQAFCILSGAGIFLLLARWLRIRPVLYSSLICRPVVLRVVASTEPQIKDASLHLFLPLRI
jgi:hypothetical protein